MENEAENECPSGIETHVDAEAFDIERFTRALVKDAQEGVTWERRKLQWSVEEEKAEEEEARARQEIN